MTKAKNNRTVKTEKVAVLVRVNESDLDYMKEVTMAETNAAAVDIFCRKHIAAGRDAARVCRKPRRAV